MGQVTVLGIGYNLKHNNNNLKILALALLNIYPNGC